MPRSFVLAAALSLTATAAFAAGNSVPTPAQVVAHHVDVIKKGDLNGVMADYADNAVVVTPPGLMPSVPKADPGTFVGKNEVRKVFVLLTDTNHLPDVQSMVADIESRGDSVAILHWVQHKGQPNQVAGEDIFLVRDGKVLFQDLR
jgi:ketosteroid isomerase-like protein